LNIFDLFNKLLLIEENMYTFNDEEAGFDGDNREGEKKALTTEMVEVIESFKNMFSESKQTNSFIGLIEGQSSLFGSMVTIDSNLLYDPLLVTG